MGLGIGPVRNSCIIGFYLGSVGTDLGVQPWKCGSSVDGEIVHNNSDAMAIP